jgi:hypothetical protein
MLRKRNIMENKRMLYKSKYSIDDYHNEMVACKKKGELSDKAIKMFTIHATEVAKCYNFESIDECSDSIASALHDFVCYWKNFKESNCVQLKLTRNFLPNESLTLILENDISYKYIASDVNDIEQRKFKIGNTTNHTLDNLYKLSSDELGSKVHVWLHKVRMKIGFMDQLNSEDLTIFSKVYVKTHHKPIIVDDNKKTPTEDGYLHMFTNPACSFNNLTSLARNGILKGLNKMNPKQFRHSNMIRMGSINPNANGFYSI